MDLIRIVSVAAPSLLFLAIMAWRTWRVGSAHRKIAEQQVEITELREEVHTLKVFKAKIDQMMEDNPYHLINLLRKNAS